MSSRWLLASLALALGCATQGPPVSFSPDKDADTDVAEDVDDAAPTVDEPPTSELPGCASPEVVCNGACIDVTVNLMHCGRCGSRCASGQSRSPSRKSGSMLSGSSRAMVLAARSSGPA